MFRKASPEDVVQTTNVVIKVVDFTDDPQDAEPAYDVNVYVDGEPVTGGKGVFSTRLYPKATALRKARAYVKELIAGLVKASGGTLRGASVHVAREILAVARELTAAKGTWYEEIDYALAVAEGQIPAYQGFLAVDFWLRRATGLLANVKNRAKAKLGEDEYVELVNLLAAYSAAWEDVGKAEQAMIDAKNRVAEITAKNKSLRALLRSF
jgi:hypothetical protein